MGLSNYLQGPPSPSYNAKSYGVKGDGVYLNDGAITTGTAILTSVTASFTSSDVGKVIKVNGAGVSGADFRTTILSRQSATQVTLSANVSTGVTGAFVVYGTDDTVAIQALINLIFATTQKSGTIFFPNGVYIINGALQTSISGQNPNCQLYLPVLDNTVSCLPAIKFMGETPPFLANSRKVGAVVLNDGAILHSTLTSVSGTLPAMFGGCNTTVPLNAATFIRGSFENIHVRVPSHAAVAGPTLTGINAARWQAMTCEDVVIDADCVSHASLTVKPTNEAAGVIYPQINTSNNMSSRNVYVSYFKYGIVFGELMTMLSAVAVTCNYGYVFTNGNYSLLCGHLRLTHCTNAILVASSTILPAYAGYSPFDIQQLDDEVETTGGNWQDGVLGLTDTDNNGSGRIIHSYIDASTHLPMAFTKSGGTGVVSQSIASGKFSIGSTSTGFIFDETNMRFGIGIVPATYPLEISKLSNTAIRIQITNTSNGSAAQSQIAAVNDGGLVTTLGVRSSGFTTNGLAVANQSTMISNSSASFLLGASSSVPTIIVYGGTATTNEVGRFDNTGLSFQVLLKSLTFSAANKMAAKTTLVAGTKAITITGLTTSHIAQVTLETPNTGASTVKFQAVCTANTLTITALLAAGTINTADVSTVNYFIVLTN